ncbi:VanW family protein [Marinicrinis lubricantis]|uniref:VanW family protein n=1 Tax=Marinicrinis lubricantis TaxID=2086470 RepID=A0ABW1IT18_9BACL
MMLPPAWQPRLKKLCIGLGLAAVVLLLSIYFYGKVNRVPPQMTINGNSLPSFSYKQLAQALYSLEAELQQLTVTLHAEKPWPHEAKLTAQQLGVYTNAKEIIHDLHELRQGSIWQKAAKRWENRSKNWELRVYVNNDTLQKTITQQWKAMHDMQPVNAKRELTAKDQIRYVPEKSVFRADLAKLQNLITAQLQMQLDQSPLLTPKLPDRMALPLRVVQPTVTVDMLKQQGIEQLVSEFTTTFPTSQSGRNHNIQATAKALDMTVLKPGEEFDYGKIIEETRSAYGFKEAPVILNGKMVPGIGGGICQVSSTLYNAILLYGLDASERRNHSLPVSYVPLGLDATFSTGYINFKFKNTTKHHLLIHAEVIDGSITVKLFGKRTDPYTYSLRSEVIETIEPTVKYVHNGKLSPGETETIQKGKPGYVVKTVRVKKQDGKVISTEELSKDRYNARPTIIAANLEGIESKTEKRPKKQIIEDGVEAPSFGDNGSPEPMETFFPYE